MTINKIVSSAEEAVADIFDGARLGVAGFGISHDYPTLMPALLAQGATDLTTISNSLGASENSLRDVVAAGRIRHLIISISGGAEPQIASGHTTVELVGQGILVERLRAGGSGIAAFYTKTGVGTIIAEGKEVREFDGERYILETGLTADFAFVRANRADRFGNLGFHGVGRNFNPAFCRGAKIVIAEVEEIVDGALDPDEIGVPGIFVSRVVERVPVKPVEFPKKPALHPGASDARKRRDFDQPERYNDKPGWTRAQICEVAAGLIPDGSYVNLGIGLPTGMSNYVSGRDITFHAENGLLGYGPRATEENWDPDVYAGSDYVSLEPGAAFFDSVTSFEMVRGGKIDVVALGGLQVDAEANLANFAKAIGVGGMIGGAMDLAAGGGKIMVLMTHLSPGGEQKLLNRCTYPLTGVGCVDTVVTDLAVLRRVDGGFTIDRVAPGFTPEEVAALTEMPLQIP